jgi:glycosyltransferase involved in cell wall biosynthesis
MLITDFAFTGMLPHDDLLAVIRTADVFALNSSYEGFSRLLIEACKLGVVTVATNVGGNPEIVEDEKNGFLVPAHDTPALTDGIEEVLEDSILRAKISQSAVLVAEHFTRDAMLTATAKTVADVVSAYASRA